MIYRPEPYAGTSKLFEEPYSRIRLPYRTAKEMKMLYPDGNFVIVGEIGGLARPPTDGDVLLTDDGKRISISARGSLKRPFEWVAGYIPLKENTYLAAAKCLLPAFLRRL